jgi:predicted tellurium resistance membrane protein TerC
MDWITQPSSWIAFATLLALEIVLGIDNIIFISILTGKLPPEQREKARMIGLGLALFTRIILLFSLKWILGLTQPLFTLGFLESVLPTVKDGAHAAAAGAHEVVGIPTQITGRDLILILGGLFLIGKATHEIHNKLEGEEHAAQGGAPKHAAFGPIIAQILILDIVFSLDSVITAVGMVKEIGIMIAAVVVAIGLMMVFAKPLADFVEKHPTIKMLALSFLVLIGFTLLVEGFDQHISKGAVYFAMGFSVLVEMLNLKMRSRKKSDPVHLKDSHLPNAKA